MWDVLRMKTGLSAEETSRLLEVAAGGTPVYVYDEAVVQARITSLTGLTSISRLHYAVKANPHRELLSLIAGRGLSFECVSAGELRLLLDLGVKPERLLFTPNFAPASEYAFAAQQGILTTLDGLYPLLHWPDLFAGRDLLLRVDPEISDGHHPHVQTAGDGSKFGLSMSEFPTAVEAARRAGARVVGLHAHVGSGIESPGLWAEVVSRLGPLVHGLKDGRVLDIGGGFGVNLDLQAADAALKQALGAVGPLELWAEPGRYVVAQAGVLLVTVTQVKDKGPLRFVGADGGMNTLIRPALYGAIHPVVPVTKWGRPSSRAVHIVGPICESADVLARDVLLPDCEEGDVLAILESGAYGAAMASTYNSRSLPREVVLS